MSRFRPALVRCSLFACCLTLTTSAWGVDIVVRRGSDKKISGEITAISKTEITVTPRTGDATVIPANEVMQVTWTGEPAGLNVARNFEKNGELVRALEGYTKAQAEAKSPSPGLSAELDYAVVRVKAKQALSEPAKLDGVITELANFLKKNADTYHFFPANKLLGDLYVQKKDLANAKTSYAKLEQATAPDTKMASKIALARVSLLENDTAAAQSAFESVAQMTATTPGEKSQQQEARLGQALCLQMQKQFADAAKLLDQVIQEASPEDSRVQAEAHVRLGDCQQALDKPREALLSYLHVDVLYPTEPALKAEALFHLAKLWNVAQHPERAEDAAERLTADYPNSEWAAKLKAPAGS